MANSDVLFDHVVRTLSLAGCAHALVCLRNAVGLQNTSEAHHLARADADAHTHAEKSHGGGAQPWHDDAVAARNPCGTGRRCGTRVAPLLAVGSGVVVVVPGLVAHDVELARLPALLADDGADVVVVQFETALSPTC